MAVEDPIEQTIMRSPTRYASRKGSGGVPIHTLTLLFGLALALGVMVWSLQIVNQGGRFSQERRLAEVRMAISEPVNKYFGNSENVGINAKEFVNARAQAVVGHGSSSAGTASNTATGVSTSGIVTNASSIKALTGSVRGDVGSDQCHVDNHNEYHGEVVKWGAHNIQATAGECCKSCRTTPGCNIWVFCPRDEGCGFAKPPSAKGECWLKRNTLAYVMENVRQGHAAVPWIAGAIYSAAEYDSYLQSNAIAVKAEEERLRKLRSNIDLPLVWLDVAVNGTLLGRIEMVLFPKESPRAAENFRLLCSGEKGLDATGHRFHFKGSYFYRIIDRFIDQTGADADGIYGGEFHDDPGGLQLKHARKGLLSMANSGPNTNGGHFSIVMDPAHHLDGHYTIFGEVVSGIQYAETINRMARGRLNNELLQSTMAQIVDAGQTRAGSVVVSPQHRSIIAAEERRVAWRNTLTFNELARLRSLYEDQSLPLVYLDVAIKGEYAGRMEMVLFAKEAPRAAESFRMLCTGEAGIALPGHEGAGRPYHFKGAYFYRIIDRFIDQAGQWTDSPLGGYFRDDPAGLKLNHSHMGLLSMANKGSNTNGAHFSIIMAPAHHLDGHYTIFGEIVDGHNVAYDINKLALGEKNNEHSNTEDVQIIDSGLLRRGTYLDSQELKSIIAEERKFISEGSKM